MAEQRAFVYAVCGAASHISTLHRSIEYLRQRTAYPIVVVTDARRNAIPIAHDTVIDVETPRHLDHHRASIFLKTSLHRQLPAGREYAYLDSDVIAAGDGVESIFDHQYGAVTFARDLATMASRVTTFSPWAVRCACPNDDGRGCSHLAEALHSKFGVRVAEDWVQWNGGVFLLGHGAAPFMEMWHNLTMQSFEDPYWVTRDQGTLIATVWKLGAQRQGCLPSEFNFLPDTNNPTLCFDRETGYALHQSIPRIRPRLLHLYQSDPGRVGWSLVRDFEEPLQQLTRARNAGRASSRVGRTLRAIARRTLRTGLGRMVRRSLSGATVDKGLEYRVIVRVKQGTANDHDAFAGTLARGLRAQGIDARVSGVPSHELINRLERHAPCIYMPSDDHGRWRSVPRRSRRVGVVARVDTLDSPHFAQIAELERDADAVVAGSAAVAARLIAVDVRLAQRVVIIPCASDLQDRLNERPLEWGAPLKVACLETTGGSLPPAAAEIIARLADDDVPVEWIPIAGAGTGAAAFDPTVFDHADVFVALAGAGITPRLLDAMGRGCVPVVAQAPGVVGELVRDGVSGYVRPDATGLAARLGALQMNPALRRSLSAAAHRSAHATDHVVTGYRLLFQRVLHDLELGVSRRVLPQGYHD